MPVLVERPQRFPPSTAVEALAAPFVSDFDRRTQIGPPVLPAPAPAHELILDGAKLAAEIAECVTGGQIERTLEGASTVDLELALDAQRALLRTGLLDPDAIHTTRPPEIAFGKRHHFSLRHISKQDENLTLSFEEREITWLRHYTKSRRAYRDKVTRAEFIVSLLREVKEGRIPYYIPDLHQRQKIAAVKESKTETIQRSRHVHKAGGLGGARGLTIKGAAATRSQLKLAERALDIAVGLDSPRLAMVALIEALIVESTIHNLTYGDSTSTGPLQVLSSTASHIGIDPRDVEAVVNEFLRNGYASHRPKGAIELAKEHPGWSAGQIAQACQGSANPGAYGRYASEAVALVNAYMGGRGRQIGTEGSKLRVHQTTPKRYAFSRGYQGKKETSWDAIKRLAEEVVWRAFFVDGRFWYVSEDRLFRQKPVYVLNEGSKGVDKIDYELDAGRKVSEATITCHTSLWAAPPGTVVELDEDNGPATGRWLVFSVTRPLFEDTAEVTLRKPNPSKLEPAPETESSSSTFTLGGGRHRQQSGTGAVTPGGRYAISAFRGRNPKEIIDDLVLPVARKHHIDVTPQSVEAANARHGPTVSGGRSDHQGPPDQAWAADMSNGQHPTPQMTALARELSVLFAINWSGSGIVNSTHHGFRFQMLYKTTTGGNHFNHVHFGVRRA